MISGVVIVHILPHDVLDLSADDAHGILILPQLLHHPKAQTHPHKPDDRCVRLLQDCSAAADVVGLGCVVACFSKLRQILRDIENKYDEWFARRT